MAASSLSARTENSRSDEGGSKKDPPLRIVQVEKADLKVRLYESASTARRR